MKNPTLFLDRDGTINMDMTGSYVTKPSEFKLIEHAAEALVLAQISGFKLAIITNQQGIAKKLYTEKDLQSIHKRMLELIRKKTNSDGFNFDDIQYCPHKQDAGCKCRKPKTEMLEKAAVKLNSDLKNSFYIGDKDADMMCAHSFGIPFILVLTGYGNDTKKGFKKFPTKPVFIAEDLLTAVKFVLQSSPTKNTL